MTIEDLVKELEALLQRLNKAAVSDESKLELETSYTRLKELLSEPSFAQKDVGGALGVPENELRQLIDHVAREPFSEPPRVSLARQLAVAADSIENSLSNNGTKGDVVGVDEAVVALHVYRRLDNRHEGSSDDSPIALELHNRRRDALHEVLDGSSVWSVLDWGETDDTQPHERVTVRVEITGESGVSVDRLPAISSVGDALSRVVDPRVAKGVATLTGDLARQQEQGRILDFEFTLEGEYIVRCDPEDYGHAITIFAPDQEPLSVPFPANERMGTSTPETVSRGGTLGVEVEGKDETPPPATEGVETEPGKHYIHVEIEDHDKHKPLQLSQGYTLSIDADVVLRDAAIATTELPAATFQEGEEIVEITVHLDSPNFEIRTKEPQTLRVPRKGRSKNKARFDIEPKHKGEGLLTAVLLKGGNFIQAITVKLQVGRAASSAVLSSETIGRPPDSATLLEPRDIQLYLIETGPGFRALLTAGNSLTADIAVDKLALDQMITQARKALEDVVYMQDKIYQKQLVIPPEINQKALQALAKEGFRLYQRLFFGPGASADSRNLGQTLRGLAQGEDALKIQITSEHFLLPWTMLYMADEFGGNDIEPGLFLGMRHIVEHNLIKRNQRGVPPRTIDSRERLKVSLNVNTGIDKAMGRPFVAGQREAWESIQAQDKAAVVIRETEKEVLEALKTDSTPDQILYFLCHAVSHSLSEGPDGSTIVLTSKANGLRLGDLHIMAPAEKRFPNAPLVFINACESAELSPLLYDGFVPYFMDKGARGVIGTECEVPALFAVDWATRFFEAFLNGRPLGRVMLELRQEFYTKHNNILGLLYALYCDGDTRVDPSLQLVPAT